MSNNSRFSTANVWNWIKSAGRSIATWKVHVEPIIFVLSLCNAARSVVTPTLSQDKMKRVYQCPVGTHDCKKFFNKKMVLWDQNYEYVNLPIACIAGIIYGSYSDRNGRKLPLLISLVSVFIDNSVYMLIWSEKTDIDLKWLYLDGAVVGMMGNFMLLMSCVNAYLADQFGDKVVLSIRMIFVSIIFSLGSLCGSQTVKHLVHLIGELGTMYIVQGMLVITFIFSLTILHNPIPNKQRNETQTESETETRVDPEPGNGILLAAQRPAPQPSFLAAVKNQFVYIINSFRIFFVRRQGHQRAFLYFTFLANFLDQLAFGEEKSLIGTYTKLAPFNWDTNEYANYKTVRPVAQIIGMVFGLIVLKYALKMRDTLIIVLAIGSMAFCILVIGLANSTAWIYVSLAPGSLHGLLNPLAYTFITCLVAPDEIGQTFAVSTIAGKLAGLVQTAVLQNIYTATVDWYQGFVWLVMFVLSAVAALFYMGVHIVAKRERVGN